MIDFELLENEKVAVIKPKGALEAEDFAHLGEEIDPFIERHGNLLGLMIYTGSFPGWEDFSALLSHLRFVRDHHRKIKKVAIVTDWKIASVLPVIGDHFVSAELKHFGFGHYGEAMKWLTGTESK